MTVESHHEDEVHSIEEDSLKISRAPLLQSEGQHDIAMSMSLEDILRRNKTNMSNSVFTFNQGFAHCTSMN